MSKTIFEHAIDQLLEVREIKEDLVTESFMTTRPACDENTSILPFTFETVRLDPGAAVRAELGEPSADAYESKIDVRSA